MSFLDKLTDDQRRTIVSLPYRIGLVVSQSDRTGGESSDEHELRALDSILNAYARDVMGSETMQYIITQTVERRDQWDGWAKQLDSVSNDCRVAIDVLNQYGDEKDAAAFQTQMLEIAEAVALAFREHEQVLNAFDNAKVHILYFMYMLEARKAKKTPKSFDQFLRISSDERKALKNLAKSLGCHYI